MATLTPCVIELRGEFDIYNKPALEDLLEHAYESVDDAFAAIAAR